MTRKHLSPEQTNFSIDYNIVPCYCINKERVIGSTNELWFRRTQFGGDAIQFRQHPQLTGCTLVPTYTACFDHCNKNLNNGRYIRTLLWLIYLLTTSNKHCGCCFSPEQHCIPSLLAPSVFATSMASKNAFILEYETFCHAHTMNTDSYPSTHSLHSSQFDSSARPNDEHNRILWVRCATQTHDTNKYQLDSMWNIHAINDFHAKCKHMSRS